MQDHGLVLDESMQGRGCKGFGCNGVFGPSALVDVEEVLDPNFGDPFT